MVGHHPLGTSQTEMAASIKMDELLVSWLGSDAVYENVLSLIEKKRPEVEVGGDLFSSDCAS